MIEDIIMSLDESGFLVYAFILLLVVVLAPYAFKIWEIKNKEKREDKKKAEERLHELEKAVAYSRSLPSYCSRCDKNSMVKIRQELDGKFIYDIYCCPYCDEEKEIPVG